MSTEPPEKKLPVPLKSKLKDFSPFAYIVVIAISILSLIVASFSLRYADLNYSLQTADQPPNVLFSNGDVAHSFHPFTLYWHNQGKTDAWHTTAKLYDFEDDKRSTEPFAVAPVLGAGARVVGGADGVSTFDKPPPSRFLACISYTDADKHPFMNAVVLQHNGPSIVDETPSPDASICK